MKKLQGLLAALCCNETPALTGAEWEKLCPYGHYPHKLGMQDCTKQGLQELALNIAQDKARRGSNWRGYPITMGHRLAPNKNLPHMGAKLGRVLDLQLREDGPYVLIAWNSLGQENVKEGWAEYPSPEWYLTDGPKGMKRPVVFAGIGMVETPNIPDAGAWTNEDPETITPNNPDDNTTMNLKQIALALGLAEDADEATILAAIETMKKAHETSETAAKEATEEADNSKKAACNEKARADKAEADLVALNEQVTTLTTAKAEAEKAVLAANEARRDLIISQAVNEGKATPAEKDKLIIAFNEDFDKAATELLSRKPAYNTKAVDMPRAEARKQQLAVNEARNEFAAVVKAHMEKTKKSYQEAFNECLKDKQHAALVMAMNG